MFVDPSGMIYYLPDGTFFLEEQDALIEQINSGVQFVRGKTENIDLTFSLGLQYSLTGLLLGGSFQGDVILDAKGNIGIAGTYGGQMNTATQTGLSAAVAITLTDAPDIYGTKGRAQSAGGSVFVPGTPAYAGFDSLQLHDDEQDTIYNGASIIGGLGLGSGAEAHYGESHTEVAKLINVYDTWDNIYNWFKGL